MTYQWKVPGLMPVDAQKAGEELERIWQEQKSLSPEVIVEESRPEDAVLHRAFEWDDLKAAQAFRREQARKVMRLIVKTETAPALPSQRPVRAFVSVERNYVPMHVALNQESSMQFLLKQAKRDLAAFLVKYRDLKQLAKFNEAIIEVIRELDCYTGTVPV